MPQPQCDFYTADFSRCSHRARGGTHYCGVHARKAQTLGERPAEGHCLCVRRVDGANRWCGGVYREGETICEWHWQRMRTAETAAQRREARVRVLQETTRAYLAHEPPMTWQQVVRDVRRRFLLRRDDPEYLTDMTAYDVARRFFVMTTPDTVPIMTFVDVWMGREEHDGGVWVAEAPVLVLPIGQMGRLAADTQNVHTAVVSRQTNSNVELLLAEEVPPQDTLTMLTTWWLVRGPTPTFATYWKVMEDVRHWYMQRTCKASGDFLYKRVLDGLTAKILVSTDGNDELFAELTKRLWEECEEAVGLCCEGHVSRLANVLVGFDETFKSPVSTGEVLQTRIAAIAEMKLSPKHKVAKAMAVMEELGIPEADRVPWLEALAE